MCKPFLMHLMGNGRTVNARGRRRQDAYSIAMSAVSSGECSMKRPYFSVGPVRLGWPLAMVCQSSNAHGWCGKVFNNSWSESFSNCHE